MGEDRDKSALLRQLRIEREQRDQPLSRGQRRLWLILAAVLLLLGAAVAYALLRSQRIEVQSASAVVPSAERAAAGCCRPPAM